MTKYPIYAALEHAREMYGVEIDEDQFETYAMSAWNKIGNKDYRMYVTKIHPEPDVEGGWSVCKPCNLDEVEAITLPFEDAQNLSSWCNHFGIYSHAIEQMIESTKRMPDEHYISGKLVKFKELGDKLLFTEPFKELTLLYKGLYTDENGFPFLNNKEVEAVAVFCAYMEHYKHGLMSKDQMEIQLAQILKKDWLQACNAARVPESVSQNEMNEILDAFVRRDVHRFGQTFKAIW